MKSHFQKRGSAALRGILAIALAGIPVTIAQAQPAGKPSTVTGLTGMWFLQRTTALRVWQSLLKNTRTLSSWTF